MSKVSKKLGDTTLSVVRGSVVESDVDVIVNAANTSMRGGGGVDGAIHRAAGPKLMEELMRVAPRGAKTGKAIITQAHNLKHKYIIHTPGPYWQGGDKGEPELLASCYRECLMLAAKHRLQSIAYCSIATGVYRFPLRQAAKIAVDTVCEVITQGEAESIDYVEFAMYGQEEYEVFSQALEGKLM